MKPATPLPWRLFTAGARAIEVAPPPPAKMGERPCVIGWPGFDTTDLTNKQNHANAAYLVHAANAYPRLVHRARCRVAFLTGMLNTLPVRLRPHYEAMVRAELANDVQLLRELGEER